jgi:hypothetical protein
MRRLISKEDYDKFLDEGKVDVRETRLSRMKKEEALDGSEFEHPLLSQSKAMMKMADKLTESLQGNNHELAEAVNKIADSMAEHNEMLEKLISKNAETVNKVVSQMATMHNDHQERAKTAERKRKSWKLKVNRDGSGFMESIDIIPIDKEVLNGSSST